MERLAKLLGMLGSDQDGEVAAAGRAVSRQVKALGIDWRKALTFGLRPAPPPSPSPPLRHRDQLDWLLSRVSRLNSWEAEFVRNLHKRRRTPTEKQLDKLDEIALRLGFRSAGL